MKKTLTIGHFPIIDHLILGVAKHNDAKSFKHLTLETTHFTNWSHFSDALVKGEIDGGFLLFPIVFDVFQKQRADVRLLLLGHREGQVLVAKKDITTINKLKGKRIFVPDTYSTHYILLHMALTEAGMSLADVEVSMGFDDPREMVDMLARDEIDAFIAAEPMGTQAVEQGVGTILTLSHDIEAHHPDCVFVMRREVLESNPEAVGELVESLVKAGLFINAYPRQSADIGAPFLGWDTNILLRSLTHDRAHILFWDLLPRIEDFLALQKVAVNDMHIWDTEIDLETLIDASFARRAYREWVIDTRRSVKDKGIERTLPGSFQEAARRFQNVFPELAGIAGLTFVEKGEKYPKGLERKKDLPDDTVAFLDDVFNGGLYAVETEYGQKKGLAFFGPEHGTEPDRVLIKLSVDDALRVLQVLSWGERIHEVKKYTVATFARDLFSSDGSISAVQTDTHVFFSMNATVFRFVALMIQHF